MLSHLIRFLGTRLVHFSCFRGNRHMNFFGRFLGKIDFPFLLILFLRVLKMCQKIVEGCIFFKLSSKSWIIKLQIRFSRNYFSMGGFVTRSFSNRFTPIISLDACHSGWNFIRSFLIGSSSFFVPKNYESSWMQLMEKSEIGLIDSKNFQRNLY